MFYQEPRKYAHVMRSAIAINGSFFNAQRMMFQYLKNAYPNEEKPWSVTDNHHLFVMCQNFTHKLHGLFDVVRRRIIRDTDVRKPPDIRILSDMFQRGVDHLFVGDGYQVAGKCNSTGQAISAQALCAHGLHLKDTRIWKKNHNWNIVAINRQCETCCCGISWLPIGIDLSILLMKNNFAHYSYAK